MSDNCFRTSKQLMVIIGYHTANEISQKKCIVQQWWYPMHIPDPWSRTSKRTNNNCGISWAEQGNSHIAQVQATLLHYHDFLDWQYGYHECKRQWSCTARPMQQLFIIRSVQGYGHVARVRATLVYYHDFLDYSMDITSVQGHGHVARDSRNAGPWSRAWVHEVMAM